MEAVNLEDSLAKRISLKDSSSETMATSACVNCVKLFGKTTYTIFQIIEIMSIQNVLVK